MNTLYDQSTAWYLVAYIASHAVNLLIDSGAQVSMLNKAEYDRLPGSHRGSLTAVGERISAANGGAIKVYGKTSLKMYLDRVCYDCEFIVADMGSLPGVLGMDFLTKNKATLHCLTGTVLLGDHKLNCRSARSGQGGRAILKNEVLLPARHVSFVAVCLATWGFGKDCDLAIEPMSTTYEEQILVPRGVVNVGQTDITLQVTNPGLKDIRLPAGFVLADLDQVTVAVNPQKHEFSSSGFVVGAAVNDAKLDLSEHLQKLVDCSSDLSDHQKALLRETLLEYEHCFEGGKYGLGRTNLVTHEIDTGDHKPFKIPPRRLGWAQRKALREEVKKMQELGVIEPSNSPWSSPPVLVKKKDNSFRFCLDYRKLNSLTKRDAHPLPRIDDCLDALAGATWFCTLDLSAGYWQIAMAPQDKEKTAFSTPGGHFEFSVLPFGVTNGCATMERLMQLVLGGLETDTCLSYMDDVIIRGRSFNETLSNLIKVLNRISSAGLRLKPGKCELFKKEVSFLGHIVCPEGIKPDPKKVEVVRNWPVPKNVSEVRSFVGFASYYRKYIGGFARIAAPLHELTTAKSFAWSAECQKAFGILISALTTAPILALPRDGCPVILDTDACDLSIGGVLSQIIDGKERVVAYASKTLSASQRNYCTTYKELLAVVKMAKVFRPYIYGQKEVLLRTDHRALLWLQNFKDIEGMLARWLTSLSEYNFRIEYREGRKHGNADGCSRIPRIPRNCKRQDCPDGGHVDKKVALVINEWNDKHAASLCRPWEAGLTSFQGLGSVAEKAGPALFSEKKNVCQSMQINHNTGSVAAAVNTQVESNWVETLSVEDIVQQQSQDQAIVLLRSWVESAQRPSFKDISKESAEVKNLWAQFPFLSLSEGKLCRKHKLPCGADVEQLVVPAVSRRKIFDHLHASKFGGHMGIGSLIAKLRRRFYWPGYKEDIIRWTHWCDVCQRRADTGRRRAPLQQSPVGMPMERMAVDILGPLPVTERGNRYIVIFCEYFTKWVEGFPLPDQTAATVADCLVNEIIVRFGIPHQLHSDQGSNFESQLFQEVCKLLGINKTRTCGYHPQSDGLVERFNRSVQDMLSKLISDRRNDWDVVLPYVLSAYRATPQHSTGMTPNLLMLGREVLLPVDIVYGYALPDQPKCPVAYVEWVRNVMEESYKRCRQELSKAAMRQARHYNKLSGDPCYNVGDWVLLFYPPIARQKLSLKFTGPFKVLRKLSEVNYEIEAPNTGKKKVVHVNQLKPYLSEVRPGDRPSLPDLPDGRDPLDPLGQQASADQLIAPWAPPMLQERGAGETPHSSAAESGTPPGGDPDSDLPEFDRQQESFDVTGKTTLNPFATPFVPSRLRKPPQRFGHNVGFI